jgi:hypothetical protein
MAEILNIDVIEPKFGGCKGETAKGRKSLLMADRLRGRV